MTVTRIFTKIVTLSPSETLILALIRKEIVMNTEKMNMPPSPYRCNVRLPIRSMRGIEMMVMATIMAPMPIVMNLAVSCERPALSNRPVE